jgi:hypothetical protein
MSIARTLLPGVVIALAVFGCKSGTATASAGAEPASAGGAAAAAVASVKQEIVDPSLNNMNAVEVTVPGNWHFQGTDAGRRAVRGDSVRGVSGDESGWAVGV